MASKRNILFIGAVLLSANKLALGLNETSEEILAWKIPAEIQNSYPYYFSGKDYEGSPVMIAEVGEWDVREVVEKGGEPLKMYKKHLWQMFTRGIESGKNESTGWIYLMDMEGFSARQAGHAGTILMWLEAFRMFEDTVRNGNMKRGIITNANSLFVHLFDLAKPLLGELQKDIEIHGSNSAKWIPKLLKIIPKDQLPEHLGGSKDFKPVRVFG